MMGRDIYKYLKWVPDNLYWDHLLILGTKIGCYQYNTLIIIIYCIYIVPFTKANQLAIMIKGARKKGCSHQGAMMMEIENSDFRKLNPNQPGGMMLFQTTPPSQDRKNKANHFFGITAIYK